MTTQISGILLAAGRGARVGIEENKVYVEIAHRPLLLHALSPFLRSPLIDEIIIVVAREEKERAASLVQGMKKEIRFVYGGEQRQDSSLAGIEEATGDIVLIHDVARPFPSQALIARVVTGVRQYGACVPVIPVADTLRYQDEVSGLLREQVSRQGLLRMQTPQGFKRELIRGCLRMSNASLSDDAQAALAAGVRVWTVSGEAINLKITTTGDIELAEAIANLVPSVSAIIQKRENDSSSQ